MSISKTRYEASAKSLNISFVKLYWFDPTNKLFRQGVPLAFQWWLHTGHILAFPKSILLYEAKPSKRILPKEQARKLQDAQAEKLTWLQANKFRSYQTDR